MTAYQKLSDSDMNYFQFKARDYLQYQREQQEWQEYCKQVVPDCAACSAENVEPTYSKSIGIQVSERKQFNPLGRTPTQPKYQKDELPEALNNIRIKLENIDLALSKMYDTSTDVEKEKKNQAKSFYNNSYSNEQALKSFEEKRKLMIQNSLKASLERIQNLPSQKPKEPSPASKIKNLGFFIPSDLQKKRVAARKACLASLQTVKPALKVPLQNVKQQSKKVSQNNQNIKSISRPTSRPRKKVTSSKPKEEVKLKIPEEDTLIKTIEADEDKDENIEYVVDGILEDLLGEAVLDLNRIKQMRSTRQAFTNKPKTDLTEDKEKLLSSDLSSSQINTVPKTIANDDSANFLKLKSFLDSSEKSQSTRVNISNNCTANGGSHHTRNSNHTLGALGEKYFINVTQPKNLYETKTPKFVCGVSHIVSVDTMKAKEISSNKDKFWKYLRDISRTVKGDFNPWTFCNVIAESILDDCIRDVSEELGDVPSSFIKDLYNQEFVQQVEDHARQPK